MPDKRVLHILPHSGGGGEVYVSALEATPGFVHDRFYLSRGRTPVSAAASLPIRIPTLTRRIRGSDLIHLHGDAAAILGLPFLRMRPAVITTHGLHLLRRSSGVQLTIIRNALRGAVAASEVVIATSTSELHELVRVVRGVDRPKLHVIFNGVELPRPSTQDARAAARAELGIAPTCSLGIFAGGLEPRKEPLLAIGASERVRDGGVPFVLAIAGTGPLSATVQAHASDGIKPLGHLPDLNRLLSAGDIFIQPSSREGMSLALLEAMSHGLAIVAADTPGNAEAVADAGLMFPAGDETALVDAVMRFAVDPGLRSTVGAKARHRIEANFGLARFLSATRTTYSNALLSASSSKLSPP